MIWPRWPGHRGLTALASRQPITKQGHWWLFWWSLRMCFKRLRCTAVCLKITSQQLIFPEAICPFYNYPHNNHSLDICCLFLQQMFNNSICSEWIKPGTCLEIQPLTYVHYTVHISVLICVLHICAYNTVKLLFCAFLSLFFYSALVFILMLSSFF